MTVDPIANCHGAAPGAIAAGGRPGVAAILKGPGAACGPSHERGVHNGAECPWEALLRSTLDAPSRCASEQPPKGILHHYARLGFMTWAQAAPGPFRIAALPGRPPAAIAPGAAP